MYKRFINEVNDSSVDKITCVMWYFSVWTKLLFIESDKYYHAFDIRPIGA